MTTTQNTKETTMTKTTISITDCGTCCTAEVVDGTLTVIRAGGCPVANLLGGIDFSQPIGALAEEILATWLDGYDGDAHDAGLRVEVGRDGADAVRRA